MSGCARKHEGVDQGQRWVEVVNEGEGEGEIETETETARDRETEVERDGEIEEGREEPTGLEEAWKWAHENEYEVEQGARVTYCEVEQAVKLQKSKGIVSRESV